MWAPDYSKSRQSCLFCVDLLIDCSDPAQWSAVMMTDRGRSIMADQWSLCRNVRSSDTSSNTVTSWGSDSARVSQLMSYYPGHFNQINDIWIPWKLNLHVAVMADSWRGELLLLLHPGGHKVSNQRFLVATERDGHLMMIKLGMRNFKAIDKALCVPVSCLDFLLYKIQIQNGYYAKSL